MYKVIYSSLNAPEHGAGAISKAARAAACLQERLTRTTHNGTLEFDTRPVDGRFIVLSKSAEALAALPMSIGSPIGHFGQFERQAEPLPIN